MELAEETALAEWLIAKQVLPVYGYQRGWPGWPEDPFIIVLEFERVTVAMSPCVLVIPMLRNDHATGDRVHFAPQCSYELSCGYALRYSAAMD
jgi:hypothetical protein